jgi:hypothetical protein
MVSHDLLQPTHRLKEGDSGRSLPGGYFWCRTLTPGNTNNIKTEKDLFRDFFVTTIFREK